MHKKMVGLLLISFFFVMGCIKENAVEQEDEIAVKKIQLPIEQDCSLGSYFVDGDVVYYSVYMPVGDYEENPDAQFDVSMETEFQSFKR